MTYNNLIIGFISGVYVSQNYNVPDIKKIINEFIKKIKDAEKK